MEAGHPDIGQAGDRVTQRLEGQRRLLGCGEPAGDHRAAGGAHAPSDADNLLRRLALTEDDLRDTAAQRAMVIYLGLPDILVRQD